MTTTPSANWNYPTSIRFGAGRIAELGKSAALLGMKRPLLVTDPGLARLPMTASALEILRQAGLEPDIFSDVKPNPTGANVDAGVAAYRSGGHDGVIAFGGGSGLDAGKVIAFMSGQTRPMWDFEDVGDWWTRADPDGIAPILAVPTTAGTGSEVGRAGVITNEATHTKKVIFHPKMLPGIVICDPELTVGMPRYFTVGTGMDALAHCLEAYSSTFYHPMGDGIAVEGIRLVLENLQRLAGYLGISGGFDGFMKVVLDLRAALDVPHTLEGLKVDGEKAGLIAEMAIVDPTAGGNPLELTLEGARAIFADALSGKL